jgi:hypothetical protein
MLALGIVVWSPAAAETQAPGEAAGRSTARCEARGIETVFRTPRVRVWVARTRERRSTVRGSFGCLLRVDRPVRLDASGSFAGRPFRVAGGKLAYSLVLDEFINPEGGPTERVMVVDLAAGRRVRETCPGGVRGCIDAEADSFDVRAMVVLPSGGVAWSATDGVHEYVGKADAGRRPELLDRAERGLEARSLRRRGHRLTWRRDGRTRSATLR